MKKVFLAMLFIAMASCLKAQNRTAVNRSSSDMVYYYANFSIVRMKEPSLNKDVYVPHISNERGHLQPMTDENGNTIYFELPINGFNYITSLGWELWLHDDHYNIIQQWCVRRKMTKEEFNRKTSEQFKTTKSVDKIPTAAEQLHELVK